MSLKPCISGTHTLFRGIFGTWISAFAVNYKLQPFSLRKRCFASPFSTRKRLIVSSTSLLRVTLSLTTTVLSQMKQRSNKWFITIAVSSYNENVFFIFFFKKTFISCKAPKVIGRQKSHTNWHLTRLVFKMCIVSNFPPPHTPWKWTGPLNIGRIRQTLILSSNIKC